MSALPTPRPFRRLGPEGWAASKVGAMENSALKRATLRSSASMAGAFRTQDYNRLEASLL